ncbi:hypothetical protein ICN10_06260 [Polynucleobacter sp. 86C-FISCH]|uniref:DUF6492 family protein n=1 Tax=Polynucleobacter sp. 86C-FISCH TaxID=2689101 RepID=UPI001C0CA8AA|nr:DUF6492 family protein [Polynucleobacter sp. 86C-FISCH]MBU3596003.1 hypothetical protein [Polynucleobacter sp. 86C-FISCH]
MKRNLSKVVSVASLGDIDVWSYGASYVKRFISADEYRIIVPGKYKEDFERKNFANYSVISEEEIIDVEIIDRLKDQFSNLEHTNTFGWYLQQFIKIEELRKNKKEYGLIWDADTIPLKKIPFLLKNGSCRAYMATENHGPYFQTLEKLLGIQKQLDYSFVSQCLCAKMSDVYRMCSEIEGRHGKNWISAILDLIEARHGEFSEYETIGNFCLNSTKNYYSFKSPKKWNRHGYRLMGSFKWLKLTRIFLALKWDYVSFEKWDKNWGLKKYIFGKK